MSHWQLTCADLRGLLLFLHLNLYYCYWTNLWYYLPLNLKVNHLYLRHYLFLQKIYCVNNLLKSAVVIFILCPICHNFSIPIFAQSICMFLYNGLLAFNQFRSYSFKINMPSELKFSF